MEVEKTCSLNCGGSGEPVCGTVSADTNRWEKEMGGDGIGGIALVQLSRVKLDEGCKRERPART